MESVMKFARLPILRGLTHKSIYKSEIVWCFECLTQVAGQILVFQQIQTSFVRGP